jgi:hypothetical protein
MRSSANKAYPVVRSIFILLVLLSALCAGLHTVADYDMGWQLATGRYVVQHHQIPRTDVLSFTSAGKPWAYPPRCRSAVLSDVHCVWLCRLELVLRAGMPRGCGLPGASGRHRQRSTWRCLRFSPLPPARLRGPILFSTVFFALFLGELWAYHCSMRSRPWLLPVIMLFWVNLHPGFIAGLGVIGAYLLH